MNFSIGTWVLFLLHLCAGAVAVSQSLQAPKLVSAFGGLRGFESSRWFHERVRDERPPDGVSMLLNAPSAARFGPGRPASDTLPSPDALFPPRPKDAPGGAAVMMSVAALRLAEREALLEKEITGGNFPEFLRTFKPIEIHAKDAEGGEHTVVYEAMLDYLAAGSDTDFVRVPLTPMTALRIAGRFGCTLPTRKMVDDIYLQAELKLEPHPLIQEREAVKTFVEHNAIIEGQRAGKPLGLLVAGIKKDVVRSDRLLEKPDRVAIYGWHKLDGTPIQPLTTVHRSTYVDYSHGIRLIRQAVLVDGKPTTVDTVLNDPVLRTLLTDE